LGIDLERINEAERKMLECFEVIMASFKATEGDIA
jgi:hypothetical protein